MLYYDAKASFRMCIIQKMQITGNFMTSLLRFSKVESSYWHLGGEERLFCSGIFLQFGKQW